MGFILIYRNKTEPDIWHNAGPYEYPDKAQFGSIAKIKRDQPRFDWKIIDRVKFHKEYEA